MHGLRLLTFAIGLLGASLASAEDEISDDGGSRHKGMVIVEPVEVTKVEPDGTVVGRNYRERRGHWGAMIGVGYNSYEPTRYVPQQTGGPSIEDLSEFRAVYTKPDTPLLELQLNAKRNLDFGSLSAEFGVGQYKNNADNPAVAATLSLTPIRLGLTFAADVIWKEPYVVPYVSVGGYVMNFREEGEEDSVGGTTKVAPYSNLGALIQLDMLDRGASRDAYLETGLQSTFVFVEVRKYYASSGGDDPDLSNTVSYGGGLRVEF